MESGWWYWDGEQEHLATGPVSVQALASMLRSGEIVGDILVSQDGETFVSPDKPRILNEHLSAPDELVRECLRHAAMDSPHWNWANDTMQYAIDGLPEAAWVLTTRLIDEAPDDGAVGYFAACYLEHLVDQHGELLIERVEASARKDPKFALALRRMYRLDGTTDEIWGRVERAAGSEDDPPA